MPVPVIYNFNPRSHERSDTVGASYCCANIISIHAPTRGATPAPDDGFMHIPISIHAPTRGATVLACACCMSILYFNPRSHERSDGNVIRCSRSGNISIHAPTRGATVPDEYSSYEENISIHAPTRGATYVTPIKGNNIFISIHAPTRGATTQGQLLLSFLIFQSTLPREERQQYCTKNLFIFIQYRQ